jgi:hypothetical protein
MVFWVVASCNLSYPEDGDKRLFGNVDTSLPDYMVPRPRRPKFLNTDLSYALEESAML